jgi:hypothetical protein
MRRLASIAVAVLSALGSAAAQPQASYESVTRAQIEMLDGLIVRDCPQQDRSVRWASLQELGYELRGDRDLRDAGVRIFTERYEASGCGAPTRQLNVQIFHGGAQAPTPRILLLPPGGTAVNSGVMVDLFRTHFPQLIALRHPACQTAPAGEPLFIVTNTALLSGEPFAADEQIWIERWDYRACGEASSIDISFSTNGERVRMGMTLSAPAPVGP